MLDSSLFHRLHLLAGLTLLCGSCFDSHGCSFDDCSGDSDCGAGSICDYGDGLGRSCVSATECVTNSDCGAHGECVQRDDEPANNPFESASPGKRVCEEGWGGAGGVLNTGGAGGAGGGGEGGAL